MSSCLKPAGKVVALIPNLEADLTKLYDSRYSIQATRLENVNVGSRARLRRNDFMPSKTIHFDVYQFDRGMYQRCTEATDMVGLQFERILNLLIAGKADGDKDVYNSRPQVEVLFPTKKYL